MNVNPLEGGLIAFIFFYVTLGFSCLGTSAVVIFAVYRFFLGKSMPMFRYVQKSFRDALCFSTFIILLLFLQGNNWLSLWTTGLLVGCIIFIRLFLLSIKREQAH
ncbi:MAG: hypothetical protein HN726_02630 [Candidatus Magasanikbacteria bacterium]|nr:hypothetical protein [Candidatus Magasanikbacteria bacterium]MBT4221314.1 hypothetical protein [Candidatus Magasanikbacteria bacterium]MBT4350838.1 hypothetical protein [Candidatus Magasanikbacteria bacterium]MBT4542162.1 hypothetical protein [Candidatus Magasanikbacteria bacterium]MBT6253438.1 hypothetical protein [Candidatus Magasanikbacteria bacterium]